MQQQTNASPDAPTHAELAAQIPPAPPAEANDASGFAKKTMRFTLFLTLGFVGAAVFWIFVLQS